MKLLVTALVLSSASAFAPSLPSPRADVHCRATPSSRYEFLTSAATAVTLATTAVWGAAAPAHAAKYGSFGVGSPEVVNPLDAEIDRSVLASKDVQDALVKVRTYKQAVQQMQTSLAADPQFNVRPILLKEFDAGVLRATLNTVNSVFEEDTQRGTDRLIRVILQDITELDVSNAQKEGIPRSPRRLETVNGKLNKLSQAFDDYLAFAK